MSRLHPLLCALFPAVAMAAMAAGHGELYLPEGIDEAQAREVVAAAIPTPPEGWELGCHYLPQRCTTLADAKRHARAIEAGVHELPCLVLCDDVGPYAVLPLHDLREEDIEKAKELASLPDRKKLYTQRLFNAHVYQLCARTALCDQADEKEMAEAIEECRSVMAHRLCSPEQQQFLGLHCLYPLLMRQYAHGYTGAHTPETEAKLLEAIAALEAARDMDPDSAVGKKAYDERERLRHARRESRKYE